MNKKIQILFTFVFIFFLSFNLQAQKKSLQRGLLAHYQFNNDFKDKSGNNNHGRKRGGMDFTDDRFGNGCSAALFNGFDSYVSVPNSPTINAPQDELSIAVWIKASLGEINQRNFKWFSVCCKSSQSNENKQNPHYRLQGSTKTASIGTGPVATRRFNFRMNIQEDVWYHYALVYDGAMIRIYLDGSEIYNYDYSESLEANNYPLEIGRDLPGALEFHHGAMDELRIYDRALTRQEIGTLYLDNSEKTPQINRCPKQTNTDKPPTETIVDTVYVPQIIYKRDTVYIPQNTNTHTRDTVYINRQKTDTVYIRKTDTVYVKRPNKTSTDITFNPLSPPVIGEKFNLRNVRFQQSKAILLPESYPDLRKVISLMKKYPKMRIQLEGHTDNVGDPNKNYTLSLHRVQVAKNYVSDKGNIDENRIETKAFGQTQPIADNNDENARKFNRRVEVLILSID